MIITVSIFYVFNVDCVLRVGPLFFVFLTTRFYHINFTLPWKITLCPLAGSEVITTTLAVAGTDSILLIRV
jgi:hypothetical protein